jgi:hypothetical protein
MAVIERERDDLLIGKIIRIDRRRLAHIQPSRTVDLVPPVSPMDIRGRHKLVTMTAE